MGVYKVTASRDRFAPRGNQYDGAAGGLNDENNVKMSKLYVQ